MNQMNQQVMYLIPNQLTEMSNYKYNGESHIAWAMITTDKNKYIFPSAFQLPLQVRCISEGDLFTGRPSWAIYFEGDKPNKPSYVFTRKVLPGYLNVVVLVIDNTPKSLKIRHKEFNGRNYFQNVFITFPYNDFVEEIVKVRTPNDKDYKPKLPRIFFKCAIYDNPDIIPLIDVIEYEEPGSDPNDIANSIYNSLLHFNISNSDSDTQGQTKSMIPNGMESSAQKQLIPMSSDNKKPINNRLSTKLARDVNSRNTGSELQFKLPTFNSSNKVQFAESAKKTLPTRFLSQHPPNSGGTTKSYQDESSYSTNGNNAFSFETPNTNKTFNPRQRLDNIMNTTFSGSSTPDTSSTEHKYNFRIIHDDNKNKNKTNDKKLDLF